MAYGKDVKIGKNCIIGQNVDLGDGVTIEDNVTIKDDVKIGAGSYICSYSILGERNVYLSHDEIKIAHEPLSIGKNSIIRSHSVIYNGSTIGDYFQSGHHATIRENAEIGHHVSIGILTDVEGHCKIGNYVRIHSDAHVGQHTTIGNYVWVFPYVCFTNDPTPPSVNMMGVTVKDFAVIATGAIILPGVTIEEDCLIAAGAVVRKDVHKGEVIGGVPGKCISTTDNIVDPVTGNKVYPWRYSFSRGMPWEGCGYEKWAQDHRDSEDS